MKKNLLFAVTVFATMTVNAQGNRKTLVNPKVSKVVTFKTFPTGETVNVSAQANPKIKTEIKNTQKVMSAPKRIGGSVNVLSVQSTEGRALNYNAGINTVAMIFRKQAGWTGVTNGNSGTMVFAYSTNAGTSWDSTIINASSANLMRHPGGTIYNPAGNTNPANAYAVGSGPWHPGATWQGNFFASKQLSFPGTNANGNAIYQDNLALVGNQKKEDFARCDMQATTDGKVRVLGGMYSDINSTTAAGQAFRGAMINTGTFNAGAFTWTVDSLKPNFKVDGAGDKQSFSSFNQAWSNDGQIGYVVFDGVDANAVAGTSMNSFLPYVYKTTNSGASWSRHAPLFDFSSIPAIGDRTFSTWSGLVKPWVSLAEGSSATVDANGNLHFLATFGSGASDHIDSLGYTFNVDFVNTWNYVTDFQTTATGWCAVVVDSLKTDGPAAADSQWGGGASGNIGQDARLQISRTDNGQKIFYSWADTDPLIFSTTFNTQPDIHMKSYDLATDLVTPTKNMSTGKVGAEFSSFWFLSSPVVMNPSAGNWVVPAVYATCDDGSTIPDNAVSYYYMDDNMFVSSDYSNAVVGKCPVLPTGIKNITSAFENLTFYPNPASTNATINVELNETAKLEITILNSVGQSVYSTLVNGNIGSNKVNVNLNNLSSGLYFYQVKVGNSKAITKKFAVEK